MLDLLNVVILAGTLLSNIVLYPDTEFLFPQSRDSVVQVSFHREWWRADGDGKCKYTGLMVPYVRDWEEVVQNGDAEPAVLPPEPGKTVGHAYVINQLLCEGKPPQAILRAGDIQKTSGKVLLVNRFHAFDLLEAKKKEDLPKWYFQVIERITKVSNQNEQAKVVLAGSQTELEKIKALPEKADANTSSTSSNTSTSN